MVGFQLQQRVQLVAVGQGRELHVRGLALGREADGTEVHSGAVGGRLQVQGGVLEIVGTIAEGGDVGIEVDAADGVGHLGDEVERPFHVEVHAHQLLQPLAVGEPEAEVEVVVGRLPLGEEAWHHGSEALGQGVPVEPSAQLAFAEVAVHQQETLVGLLAGLDVQVFNVILVVLALSHGEIVQVQRAFGIVGRQAGNVGIDHAREDGLSPTVAEVQRLGGKGGNVAHDAQVGLGLSLAEEAFHVGLQVGVVHRHVAADFAGSVDAVDV